MFFSIALLFSIIFLSACSLDSSSRGMSQEISITADEVPGELDKQTIISSITSSPSTEIDDIIEVNFPLVDTFSDNNESAEIYATTQFTLSELANVLEEATNPTEVSDEIDDQQIFIYPDAFLTLAPSVDDDKVLLIEVASETYVRNNYSPSFLQTYFAIRLLDDMFGSNWSRSKSSDSSGSGSTLRGNTTFRGGGFGFGK
ncbi:DUF4247 domain-containing protein [Oceanobacillus bengalensis]|uniref:DUF4247 domain-containing protein n=3 Tax=Oceanobacillus bengalensis TaxID=1435466 RepID=A0A494YWT0_9BACI|nr:DUF4247 domain-containing protein [Oceanobacillus bengalensis]